MSKFEHQCIVVSVLFAISCEMIQYNNIGNFGMVYGEFARIVFYIVLFDVLGNFIIKLLNKRLKKSRVDYLGIDFILCGLLAGFMYAAANRPYFISFIVMQFIVYFFPIFGFAVYLWYVICVREDKEPE